MANLGITDFRIIPAADEETAAEGLSPAETVKAIARGKALSVAAEHRESLVIAADTLVYLDGEPLGKPHDEADALCMLMRLSGRTHEVYSGVCVMQNGREESAAECTKVTFRAFSEDEARRYIATGEPMDKAGAYGAQGRGSVLIERIDGDFFNVMGLPVCRLNLMLRELGLDF